MGVKPSYNKKRRPDNSSSGTTCSGTLVIFCLQKVFFFCRCCHNPLEMYFPGITGNVNALSAIEFKIPKNRKGKKNVNRCSATNP